MLCLELYEQNLNFHLVRICFGKKNKIKLKVSLI